MNWDLNGIQILGLVALVSGPFFMLLAATSEPRRDDTKGILNQITWRWDGLAFTVATIMVVRGDELSLYLAVAIMALSAIPAIMQAVQKQREIGNSSTKDKK